MTERWKQVVLVASTSFAVISWLSSTLSILPNSTNMTFGMIGAALATVFMAHSAITSLKESVFGVDILATIAVITSIIVGEYIAATVVVLMLGGGEILEDFSFNRATEAMQKLIENSPKSAIVVRNGKETEIPIDEVKRGETVVVKPGGRIPVDGVILKGNANVNQSSVTGESMPVDKSKGDTVYSGTIVQLGVLEVQATAVGKESTYGRIVQMVQEAEEHKAPIERMADKYAKYFTPIILVTGVIVYLFTNDILNVASIFVIACPCALTLATPIAIVASRGNAARDGVLIRNGESLEKLSKLDVLVLDKTGTVTKGRPEVVDVTGFGHSEAEVLRLATTAESYSEHPLARAVLKEAEERGVNAEAWTDFEALPGLGVRARTRSGFIVLGSQKMLERFFIPLTHEAMEYLAVHGRERTVFFVAKDDEVVGALEIADTLRPEVKGMLSEVKAGHALKTVMLTGDKRAAASVVGERIGIDEVVSDLMPSEKVDYIRNLRSKGSTVAMIGDGINDAPALATADVGIAMGLTGTDVTIETAGITLATDDLRKLPKLLRISRATMKIIKQNIAFAMAVNLIGVLLSVLGFMQPLVAAAIHESNSLIVVINSLRLLKVD